MEVANQNGPRSYLLYDEQKQAVQIWWFFNGFRLDLVITLGFKYFIPRGGKAKMEEV